MTERTEPLFIESTAIETVGIQIPGATPNGLDAQLLNVDLARGIIATIIHFKPGVSIPAHFHNGGSEAHFVLDGDLIDAGRTCRPGAYLTHAAGVVHGGEFVERNGAAARCGWGPGRSARWGQKQRDARQPDEPDNRLTGTALVRRSGMLGVVCHVLRCPIGEYTRESMPFLIAVSLVTLFLIFVPGDDRSRGRALMPSHLDALLRLLGPPSERQRSDLRRATDIVLMENGGPLRLRPALA
jgi:quercetin dioxygenase-like cupin family protein